LNILILGIRGVPAEHGGFETFAENLCIFLKKNNWEVTVYCQIDGKGKIYEDYWNGIRLVNIPISQSGPIGTIIFDFKSVWHARKSGGLHLTLGYNTALFNVIQRIFGIKNIINMDGIEWKRKKWGKVAKTWFWLNERFGCWFGNHLIADHPRIEDHLATRVNRKKITMIPYGADAVTEANAELLKPFGIEPDRFAVVIARPEPENSFLEIVQAFTQSNNQYKLVVLGNFNPEQNAYHKMVMHAAGENVVFPGAVYDKATVAALRKFSRFYIHGHQVGGTNPSLVEALGAGCAVVAHDNHFNRWVAGDEASYFASVTQLTEFFQTAFYDDDYMKRLREASYTRFSDKFQWQQILQQYETLLLQYSNN
jgi:glycosyltransferase involved in cell wall biosynthesis